MKYIIGIISYLPDEENLRAYRQNKLVSLINKCNELFNLPIVIVAQNWKSFDIPGCLIYNYKDRLGITGARKELRRIFLESDNDVLIMMDDDLELLGTRDGALEYLQQIEANPGKYGVFLDRTLKLFSISKDLFNKIDYPDLEPEKGEIFEDIYMVLALDKLYPQLRFNFRKTGRLNQNSDSANDKNSTWWAHQYDKHQIGDKTRALVKEL